MCILACVILLLSTSGIDGFPGMDEAAHHDHCGSAESTAGHAHGDADDHHETPDSPCHHHDVHCCCTHAPVVAVIHSVGTTMGAPSRVVPPASERFATSISLHRILHVPLA